MKLFILFSLLVFPIIIISAIRVKRDKAICLLERQETGVLRGISALFIIESHFLSWAIDMGAEVSKLLQIVIGQLGGIGVLIFFFVSGYGIYESYASNIPSYDFVKKRLGNVYLPYVFIKLIILIINYFTKRIQYNLCDELVDVLLINDWFIAVIMLQYASFFVLRKLIENKKRFMVCSLIVDFVLTLVFIFQGKPLRWFNALWLFTIGIIVAEFKNKIIGYYNTRFISKCIFCFGGFLINGVIFACYKSEILFISVFKIISGFFLAIFICGILRRITLKSGILSSIGRKSMYYYVVHMNIWELLSKVYEPDNRIILAFLITIVAVEILFFLYENIKKIVGNLCKI